MTTYWAIRRRELAKKNAPDLEVVEVKPKKAKAKAAPKKKAAAKKAKPAANDADVTIEPAVGSLGAEVVVEG